MTAPIADAELAEIRALADGFRGTFAFDPQHDDDRGCGHIADFVRIDDRLRYAPEGFDVRDDEATTISDCLDEHVAQPLAEMLNAVPRLLDLIAHQRAALRGKTLSGESPVVVEAERDELRMEVERLRNIEAKAMKLAASVETMMPALKTGWPRASQDLLDALDAYRKERP